MTAATTPRTIVSQPCIDRELAAGEVVLERVGRWNSMLNFWAATGDAERLAETVEGRDSHAGRVLLGRPMHIVDRADWWPLLVAECDALCAAARRRFDEAY